MIISKEDLAFYKRQDRLANGFTNMGVRLSRKLFDKRYKFLVLLREVEYYKNNPSFFNKLILLFKFYRFKNVSVKLGYSIPPNCFEAGLSCHITAR